MRKLTPTEFQLPKAFHDWFNPDQHLEVLRYYCAPRSRVYMLWNALTVWDSTNAASRAVDAELAVHEPATQGLIAREVCLNRVSNPSVYREGFIMSNFMDAAGPRTHIILHGEGVYENHRGDSVVYRKGDVLLFDEQDYDNRFFNRSTGYSIEITCCWGPANEKTNWQLFRNRYVGEQANAGR